ncbi:hypothetical protein PRZ48_006562 [Zasmidium cellare]|uniref:Aquaporin n=1 Tax=Zasmidium cellare TaxID=395010 RepID=A0ABR0ENS0_ZASCE|nr:hypothetical protein PRZ48_006562 [Zasmidium cellare]
MSSFSKTAMHATSSKSVMHKPLYGYFEPSDSYRQSGLRNHLVAATGEFVGTYIFLLLAFLGHSAALKEKPLDSTNGNLYVALSYGFSYLATIQLMHEISGGFFNPVTTIALALCGELPVLRGFIFFPAQFLGAVLAAETVSVIVPGDAQVLQTVLQADVHIVQGLFLEMVRPFVSTIMRMLIALQCLTAILVFAVLRITAYDPRSNFMFSISVGLTYFATQLAGGGFTGASLNPMRSLAPCITTGDFPSYHWIYWVGPLLGALLASSYYHLVRYFNYWAVETEQSMWLPSETSPLLQTTYRQTESPGPASPRTRRQTLTDASQRDTNDSQERGDDNRKQHHPHYPYYRYRREGHFDLVPNKDPGRRFSDGKMFERAQRQEQAENQPAFEESERLRKSRGKDKVVPLDV